MERVTPYQHTRDTTLVCEGFTLSYATAWLYPALAAEQGVVFSSSSSSLCPPPTSPDATEALSAAPTQYPSSSSLSSSAGEWVTFESPGDKAARVESTRGWRALSRAERDAGLPSSMGQILIPFFRCTLCGICIGPGYYEQELYLYPVAPGETVCLRDDAMHTFPEGVWLLCCGGCARHKSRRLSTFFRLVDATCWSTTRLTAKEGEPLRSTVIAQEAAGLRAALTDYLLARIQYLLALLAISLGGRAVLLPLLPYLSHLTTPKKDTPATVSPVVPLLSSKVAALSGRTQGAIGVRTEETAAVSHDKKTNTRGRDKHRRNGGEEQEEREQQQYGVSLPPPITTISPSLKPPHRRHLHPLVGTQHHGGRIARVVGGHTPPTTPDTLARRAQYRTAVLSASRQREEVKEDGAGGQQQGEERWAS